MGSIWRAAVVVFVAFTSAVYAQPESVPRLFRIVNTFHPANRLAPSPVESVTVSIYREEHGGAPLWSETQNVDVDNDGHYVLLVGSVSGAVPADLFATSELRWLGIQFNRTAETEQPRVLLVSVPYALQARDAGMLGGRPASDYQLASPSGQASTANPSEKLVPETPAITTKSVELKPKVMSGTSGYLGQFINSTELGNSVLFQSANAFIGIGTAAPAFAVDIVSGITGPAAAVRIGNPLVDNRLRVESKSPYAVGMKTGVAGTYAWMGVTTAGHYQFSDQYGNPLFTIQQDGSVGLGTTSPQSSLDVAGDINAGGVLKLHGSPAVQIGQTTGNTATGYLALALNLAGTNDTAVGFNALAFNSTGNQNVASGAYTMYSNSSGSFNVASGYGALQSNTSGSYNTGIGYQALDSSTGASFNTAVGAYALSGNTLGQDNTATGFRALAGNTIGNQNTAHGHYALYSNASGVNNTATGFYALYNNTGSNNIGVGFQAGYFVSGGHSNNIHIGSQGLSSDDSVIRIGTAGTQRSLYLAGVRGGSTGNNDAVPVVIDSNGQLGTINSSRRFKEDILDMGSASSGLMSLRPVTYRYKTAFADGTKPIQYGLIAEEVAEVYPELVARAADGQIETVKYQVLDSMLLNEVQRQERTIQRQQCEINALERRLIDLERRVINHQ